MEEPGQVTGGRLRGQLVDRWGMTASGKVDQMQEVGCESEWEVSDDTVLTLYYWKVEKSDIWDSEIVNPYEMYKNTNIKYI